MRLVDVDALKEDYRMANDCKDCKTYVRDCEYDRIYTKMDFCGWLDDAPTVDAVPVVHGHWIKFGVSDKDGNHQYRCSVCECEEIHSPLVKVSYCWNCGARMDGKDGDTDGV